MNWTRRMAAICLGLMLLAARPGPVSARDNPGLRDQAASTSGFTFADLGEPDLTVRLIYEQVFVDFPVSGGHRIARATLSLHTQHSPELLPDLSDIVIALNDEPVTNIILTPENAADSTTEIDLPLAALRPGENELLLRLSMRLVENGCGDVDDPDLWATIFADSSISFEAQETPTAADLSQFPAPFSTYAAVPGGPQLSIMLPPAPSSAELTVAAQVAATLGQAAGWESPPLSAFLANQFDSTRLASDSLITITTGSSNPASRSYPSGLTVSPSPYNANQLLLVVAGADEQELLRAAAMLTTRSARAGLGGTHLDPVQLQPQSLPPKPSRSTLADLGLSTKRVRGIGLHDLYYPIDVPYDWKTTSEASAEIHFTHGPAISAASLMTAYINGFETANIRLDNRNDDDGRLVMQLSPRQLHPGRNWLHLVFDLHMPREDCKFRYFDEAWAEVSAEESLLNLAHVVSAAPLELHYLPSHLIVPDDLSTDLFVLPAAPSNTDLTAMVRLAAKLGTYSAADTLRIRATTADQFAPGEETVNVIAIGSPETNALIGRYDAALPQPLALVNGQLAPSAGRPLLAEELTGQAAYIEVLPSPWSRFDSLVVLSAHTPSLLLRAVDVIPTGGRRLKQEGSVAVVTATEVTGFTFGNLAGDSLSASNRMLVAAILVGAFVLIAALGIYVFYRQRRVRQQENDE